MVRVQEGVQCAASATLQAISEDVPKTPVCTGKEKVRMDARHFKWLEESRVHCHTNIMQIQY